MYQPVMQFYKRFFSIIIICINHSKSRINQRLRCQHCLSGSPWFRPSNRHLSRNIVDILKTILYINTLRGTNFFNSVSNYFFKIFFNILPDNKNNLIKSRFDCIIDRIIHNHMSIIIHQSQLLNPFSES